MTILRQWKRSVLLGVLGLLAVGGLAWTLAAQPAGDLLKGPPRPMARIQIRAHGPDLFGSRERGTDDSPEAVRRFQNSQVQLIRSHRILDAALAHPELGKLALIQRQSDPVGWIQNHLQVRFAEESEVLEISLDSGDHGEAAKLINAVVDSYQRHFSEMKDRERDEQQKLLQMLSHEYSKKLIDRRHEMLELSQKSDQHSPFGEQAAGAVYESLRLQLVKLDLEQAEARTLLDRRRKASNAEADPAGTEIAKLEDRIAVIEPQRKLLAGELDRIASAATRSQDEQKLEFLRAELNGLRDTARKIDEELERLKFESRTSDRILWIDRAQAPRSDGA